MDELKRTIETLHNQRAGWATRKEAAHQLGDAAQRARAALEALRDDPDRDVRAAIRSALSATPNGAEISIEALAQYCHKPGRRTVSPHEDGFKIEAQIDASRTQTVYMLPRLQDDGTPILRVFSPCGKPDSSSAAWALRSNANLVGCAFAVENFERFEHLIIVKNFLRHRASPAEVLAAVKQIAYYGDWLEKRLNGTDQL